MQANFGKTALIWGALLVCLVLTWGCARLNLDGANVAIALAIAITKAALIAVFFMELKSSPRSMWIIAGAGVFWVAVLFSLSLSDYLTRGYTWAHP
jgi:cytochrome c oxidase subunit 4